MHTLIIIVIVSLCIDTLLSGTFTTHASSLYSSLLLTHYCTQIDVNITEWILPSLYVGQFYYRLLHIEPYHSEPGREHYTVTVSERGQEKERVFYGRLYHLDWTARENQCLYVGNSQAGAEKGESDSVIAGSYHDYEVSSIFSEDGYQFGLFNSNDCVVDN